MRILGIETSCDETGIALYDSAGGVLAECLQSQTALHADYGGVVPELASRDHIRHVLSLTEEVLIAAGHALGQDEAAAPDGIAYTAGPGLAGALLAGACFARALAYARGLPAIGVHHMEGHLLAVMLEESPPTFPFAALLVSGGHTQLLQADGLGRYRLLGDTLDDAAGEAFDKVARMLGLSYPGGPAVAHLAEKGDPQRFDFPRPMTERPGLDFSFSGLKTALMNTVRKERAREGSLSPQTAADIAASFQEAVVDTLTKKCLSALSDTGLGTLVVAGGVGANRRLRQSLESALAQRGICLRYPRPALCTDNGAMIAYAGCRRLSAGQEDSLAVAVRPRWSLTELAPPPGHS